MYIEWQTIITIAAVLTAIITIFSVIFAVYRWYLKQNKQDTDIKKVKEEQCVICYCLLACLDGLRQLGANGNVTDAYNKMEKHINKQAHNWAE